MALHFSPVGFSVFRHRRAHGIRAVASEDLAMVKTEEEKLKLGSSDLKVTKLGIGAWSWGDTSYWNNFEWDDRKMKAAKAAFNASVDCGITFFDTAEVYGSRFSFGAINSETLLGRFIKERKEKDPALEVAVATKFAALPWRLSRQSVISALKDSLCRLGLSSVELYQLHWPGIWGNEGYIDDVADLSHGFSVKLAASVNVLALYSLSAGKIWVLAAKTVGDEDGAMGVRLMKCAVIDCSIPVCSIFVSFGFLLLGEENGVRVFQLRPLVKGDVNKQRESGLTRANKNKTGGLNNEIRSIEGLCLQKGAIRRINGSKGLYNADMICSKYAVNGFSDRSIHKEGTGEMSCEGKTEEHRLSAKHRIVKLKQDSGEGGTCFVMFNTKEVESLSSTVVCIKAVSIHALSLKRFLILDSVGDLHLLNLSDTSLGSKVTGSTRHLTSTMKVQMLAVLPDISKRTQTVWISDGFCSVHMMTVSDTDTSANENDYSHSEENPVQISDIQAIFASEKIQDVIPLDTNAILVLGQGNIFAYAIS